MIETKQPKVFLYNCTRLPNKSLGLAISAWHSDSFYESPTEMSGQEATELSDLGLKVYHRVALEYINMIFVIKNVSRAFQQQLTRTRLAGYSIQSLRVVTKKGFATNRHYTMPPDLTDTMQELFHKAMCDIETRYQAMLDMGWKPEDARGILPLNVHSDISMVINLSSLHHMLTQRFCVLTQWEYRQVAIQMANLVRTNIGEKYAKDMEAPCVKAKKCPMREEYCGVPVWKQGFYERQITYKTWVPNQ